MGAARKGVGMAESSTKKKKKVFLVSCSLIRLLGVLPEVSGEGLSDCHSTTNWCHQLSRVGWQGKNN